MIQTFREADFNILCDRVAEKEELARLIIHTYGYPPCWTRPNSFETLVLTILEQQVSLASAYAAYQKLKTRIPEITPTNLLSLTDDELRSCYFSWQKIIYTRELANAIINRKIDLKKFEKESDDSVRNTLKQLKGIGDWTVDIYLIHALQRSDVFPLGDLALINAIKIALNKPDVTKKDINSWSENWKPYRSIATMIFWHFYIHKKNIKLIH